MTDYDLVTETAKIYAQRREKFGSLVDIFVGKAPLKQNRKEKKMPNTKNARDLMSDAKFYEAYARHNKEEDRYETWKEAIFRVMEMHREYYKEVMTPELSALIDISQKAYEDKELLGAQRALQFGGEQLLRNHAKLYNCSATYLDRVDFFKEALFLMLSGCGIGFSVQTRHIASLPDITKRTKSAKTFIVQDSIEGWSDAVGALMSSFFVSGGDDNYRGRKIYFDLSLVRPKGAEISGGFKAPGPEPLRIALDKMELLLTEVLKNGETKLRPIVAYDIAMFMADAVIAGGVRRAASICLFSKEDTEMIKAKTGDWFQKSPQRGRSNNSCVLLRGDTTEEEFAAIMHSVQHSGEPGFVWTDDLDVLFNPCVTGDSSIMTSEGPRQVNDLIGEQFKAVVDGKEYKTTAKGFWKTGDKEVFKLTLKDGSDLKLTDNHKVNTARGWVEVKNLRTDDAIVLHNHSNYSWGATDISDREIGWLLGNLVSNGLFNKTSAILKYWEHETYLIDIAKKYLSKHCKAYKELDRRETGDMVLTSSEELKHIAASYNIFPRDKAPDHLLEEKSSTFYTGYISGLFDADGSVQGTQQKGASICLTQNNLGILTQVQRMLLRLGIKSKIFKDRKAGGYSELPDGKGGYSEYFCKTVHELVISNESLFKYRDIVGFKNTSKMETLNKLLGMYTRNPNKDKYYSHVDTIEYIGIEPVYDVTVPGPEAFDANGLYVHNCVEIGMYGYTEDGRSGWQMCVAGDTKLIHSDGIDCIKTLADTQTAISIWNGTEYKKVIPYQTGTEDKLYRVYFNDGTHLDATSNHRFLVKHRFEKEYREADTKSLIEELKTSKYQLSVPRAKFNRNAFVGKDLLNAYEYGFILGDGCVRTRESKHGTVFRNPIVDIFNDTGKENITFSKIRKVSVHKDNPNRISYVYEGLDNKLAYDIKYSQGLPREIKKLSGDSLLQFFAGWLDADGSNASKGIRLYGDEYKLRDAQLLFTKLGINSSINLCYKEGEDAVIYDKYIKRNKSVWYLQITRTIDIPCQRLKCNNTNEAKHKGKNQVIKCIEELEGVHESYCLTEPETGQCVFNNVLTLQCNLCEINGSKSNTKEAFLAQCKAASILSTLQAGYTDFKYLSAASKEIIERESLTGVGITGWMNNPDVLFDKTNQRAGAEEVKKWNKITADLIGINQAARVSCVKPSGNASVLLGTASGIHGEHSKRYLRHVQMNKEGEVAKLFNENNPKMCEDSVWTNGTDYAIAFPIISPEGSIYKSDLLGVKQLEYVKSAQENWIEYGTNPELCVKPFLRHNVSNTITVDDWKEVEDYIFTNRHSLCGVSLLAAAGDKAYPQAPFTEVFTVDELTAKYGTESMFSSGLIEAGLHAFNSNLWNACSTALGFGEQLNDTHEHLLKRDFIRRFDKFSEHFTSKEDCSNCLKDVYNLHKWWRIQNSMKGVNWATDLNAKEFVDVDTLGSQGCSGGACEIEF